MICVDVEYHSDIREEFEVMVFKLTGFTYKCIALSSDTASADTWEFAADISRKIDACCTEYLCYHGSSGSLAVSTGNAYCIVVPSGNYTEKVGSFKYRYAACTGSHEFRIVLHNSSCVDDKISTFYIFCTLTDENGDAHFSDSFKSFCLVVVGACEIVSLRVKYLSKGVHAGTAYADEVYVLFAFENVDIQFRSPFVVTVAHNTSSNAVCICEQKVNFF